MKLMVRFATNPTLEAWLRKPECVRGSVGKGNLKKMFARTNSTDGTDHNT
jgi:hypothetical protein